jgi:hypothetical protein
MSAVRLAHLIDESIGARLTSLGEIGRALGSMKAPSRRGLTRVAAVLDERMPAAVATSHLEQAFLPCLHGSDVPIPVGQFAHPSPALAARTVDFVYPEQKMIIELDGRRWHERVSAGRVDRDRDRAAAVAGYVTLRLLAEHLRDDPDGIRADVLAVLKARNPQRSELIESPAATFGVSGLD